MPKLQVHFSNSLLWSHEFIFTFSEQPTAKKRTHNTGTRVLVHVTQKKQHYLFYVTKEPLLQTLRWEGTLCPFLHKTLDLLVYASKLFFCPPKKRLSPHTLSLSHRPWSLIPRPSTYPTPPRSTPPLAVSTHAPTVRLGHCCLPRVPPKTATFPAPNTSNLPRLG